MQGSNSLQEHPLVWINKSCYTVYFPRRYLHSIFSSPFLVSGHSWVFVRWWLRRSQQHNNPLTCFTPSQVFLAPAWPSDLCQSQHSCRGHHHSHHTLRYRDCLQCCFVLCTPTLLWPSKEKKKGVGGGISTCWIGGRPPMGLWPGSLIL